jgi:pyruvate/2-oxoglutarate/acetoin dehydrogenase E1 component
MKNELTFAEAILEAQKYILASNPNVVLMGQLVDSPGGVFGTTKGLIDIFGSSRVIDYPPAEQLMTASAIGMAISGIKPILVHQRVDFMLYSLDAIVNWLALWNFKSGDVSEVPILIRIIVGKGWGQGPQHSKSLHTWFGQLPDINVVMPTNSSTAYWSIREHFNQSKPTIMIEPRNVFGQKSFVDFETGIPSILNQSFVEIDGSDLTIAYVGGARTQVFEAASQLKSRHDIQAEVIDINSISNPNHEIIFESLLKTKKLLVVDPTWSRYSVSSEIISNIAQRNLSELRILYKRLNWPNSFVPMSSVLENQFYTQTENIVDESLKLMDGLP